MMGINWLTALWFSAPGLTKFNIVEISLLCFKNVEYISIINSLFSAAIVGSIVVVAASCKFALFINNKSGCRFVILSE